MQLDLLNYVTCAFSNGFLPQEVTDSLVVLIPKVHPLEKVSQFCPIALCTVLYKLITKIIVNRLKPILSKLIVPFQCSFVSDCQITDNIIMV